MVIGHESAGTVIETGSQVTTCQVGDHVALEPGVSCGLCQQCKTGRYNLCPEMKFFATPPVHGSLANQVRAGGNTVICRGDVRIRSCVCACVYLCICAYVCVYICKNICLHVHIFMFAYRYIYALMHIYIFMFGFDMCMCEQGLLLMEMIFFQIL